MNTLETISIEKYAEALNNLIGVDSAYMAGDKDADAIVELIVAAKKLENRVKELQIEKDALIKNYTECMRDYARDIFEDIEKLKHTKFDWSDVIEWDGIAELKKKYVEDEI